jgi:phosphate transport system permease protein
VRLDPHLTQRLVKTLLWTLTGFTLLILIFIIADIAVKGLPQVTPGFLSQDSTDMGRAGGIFPTIVATAYITLLAIVLASPLGVGTAIYLTEYTREGWATRIIRFGSECLAGVPSIILGLFGFVLFVLKLGLGWSVLSGGLTLAIMVLPIIIRTSEEAIKAVPQDYRTACYALGMSQWQTVTRIVLPSALPGITTGIMLSIGRSLGETAVLLFTAGAALRTPVSVFDSGRTMAVHFYILAREGLSMPNAYGTAAVLVVSILLINIVAYTLMQRLMKRYS